MQNNEPQGIRCVSYCRVSSPAQATDEELADLGIRRRRSRRRNVNEEDIHSHPQSLARQRRYVEEIAEKLGLELVRQFTDVASGWKNTLTRKSWLDMQEYCRDTGVQTILCFDFSRFGRPEKFDDLGKIMHWLQTGHFRIIGGGHDHVFGVNDTSDLVIFIEMWSSGAFSKKHSMNMLDAYAELRKRRLHPTGQRAFGFQKAKAQFDGGVRSCFIAHPVEAEVVRAIFERMATGESCKGIAADLAARGVPTVAGGIWNHSHIKAMIRKPIYMGKYVFDGELDDASNVEALVPAHLWLAANGVLDRQGELYKARRRGPTRKGEPTTGRGGRTSATALYDGLLVCGKCGANLLISYNHEDALADGTPTRYVGYQCRCSYHRAPGCNQPQITERRVTEWLRANSQRLFTPEIWRQRQVDADERSGELRVQLRAAEARVLYYQEQMDDPECPFARVDLNKRATPWVEKRDRLLGELARIDQAAAAAKMAITYGDLASIFASRSTLKHFAALCIEQLVIEDRQVVSWQLRRQDDLADEGLIPQWLLDEVLARYPLCKDPKDLPLVVPDWQSALRLLNHGSAWRAAEVEETIRRVEAALAQWSVDNADNRRSCAPVVEGHGQVPRPGLSPEWQDGTPRRRWQR